MSSRSVLAMGVLLVAFAALLGIGCGRRVDDKWTRMRPPVYPATGVVEYDGQPVAAAKVTLLSGKDDGNESQAQMAYGQTDSSGRFRLRRYPSHLTAQTRFASSWKKKRPEESFALMLPLKKHARVAVLVSLAGVSLALMAGSAEAGPAVKGEPTNDAERAATKQAADAVVDAKYAALVATLPTEEQAWETALQKNLGSFYLPLHKRDKLAGRSNAWDFVKDDPSLPRVLLIGDSVSRGYTQAARAALAGKANVHRAPANCGPTTSGLKNIEAWLGDGKWDVIHFNFGIHDRNTPLADYTARLEKLVERLEATGATLVWASTTPIPDKPEAVQTAASIVEKNAAAAAVMQRQGIATDDLFAFITPHLGDVQPPGDVHFTAAGYDLLGGQVAESILAVLGSRKAR